MYGRFDVKGSSLYFVLFFFFFSASYANFARHSGVKIKLIINLIPVREKEKNIYIKCAAHHISEKMIKIAVPSRTYFLVINIDFPILIEKFDFKQNQFLFTERALLAPLYNS